MKKVFCLVFAVIMLFSSAFTAYSTVIAEYGEWSVTQYSGNDWSIQAYNGSDTELTLLSGYGKIRIVGVNGYVFTNNTDITSVIVSQPINFLGDYSFTGASNLSYVNLPTSLRIIGVAAFRGTSSLTEINLQVTNVGEILPFTFMESGIMSVEMPYTCTSIGAYAFANCCNLEQVVIPNRVTFIGDTAFYGSENVVIYANSESYAIEYAIEKGIPYVITNPVEPTVLPSEPDPTEPQPTEPDSTEPDPHSIVYVIGDSDGDGEISILDATKIQRLLAELDDDPDGMIAMRGDSNGDGIDILDATRIQRYLAEYYVAEPIGETVAASLD